MRSLQSAVRRLHDLGMVHCETMEAQDELTPLGTNTSSSTSNTCKSSHKEMWESEAAEQWAKQSG